MLLLVAPDDLGRPAAFKPVLALGPCCSVRTGSVGTLGTSSTTAAAAEVPSAAAAVGVAVAAGRIWPAAALRGLLRCIGMLTPGECKAAPVADSQAAKFMVFLAGAPVLIGTVAANDPAGATATADGAESFPAVSAVGTATGSGSAAAGGVGALLRDLATQSLAATSVGGVLLRPLPEVPAAAPAAARSGPAIGAFLVLIGDRGGPGILEGNLAATVAASTIFLGDLGRADAAWLFPAGSTGCVAPSLAALLPAVAAAEEPPGLGEALGGALCEFWGLAAGPGSGVCDFPHFGEVGGTAAACCFTDSS